MIISQVEIINKKEFLVITPDVDYEIFVIHIAAPVQQIIIFIHLCYEHQIALLIRVEILT